jgi:hypothetical protein
MIDCSSADQVLRSYTALFAHPLAFSRESNKQTESGDLQFRPMWYVRRSCNLERPMAVEHFDVLIMGAGLSGIDAAHHLQKLCPNKSYLILEQRERIGGTWDLFRYPGIRSDSDMLTMGYSFRPWTSPKAISPGDDIRDYMTATARDEGIDRHIRFRHRIQRAAWSSQEAKWTVDTMCILPDGRNEPVTLTCNFLFSCAGYYRYSAGYTPEFPDTGRFSGRIVHPQAWPEDLDYAGKRVVIIGSGATAVTLLPAMVKTAGHVTMLQRSPTYIVSAPEQDAIANRLRGVLPAMWAYKFSRWKNVAFMIYFYQILRRTPRRKCIPHTVLSADRGLGWISAIISPITSSGPYSLNLLSRYLADHVGWCEAKRLGKRENGRKEHVAKEPPHQKAHHRQGPKKPASLYQPSVSTRRTSLARKWSEKKPFVPHVLAFSIRSDRRG